MVLFAPTRSSLPGRVLFGFLAGFVDRVGIRRSPALAGGLVRGGAPQRSANRGRLERRAAVDRARGERPLGAWDGAALRTPATIGVGPVLVVALGQLSAQTVAG